jgi:hypothetical protein
MESAIISGFIVAVFFLGFVMGYIVGRAAQ